MDLSILSAYGIDCEKGVARCLNDPDLYARMLTLFLEDDTLPKARLAMADRDYTALFHAMHALKGACGNAEMTTLYMAVCALVDVLRHDAGSDAQIADLYAAVEAAYTRAREGILLAGGTTA